MGAHLRRFRYERSNHAACFRDNPCESDSVRARWPGIENSTTRTRRCKVAQPRFGGCAPARHQCARWKDTHASRRRFALRGVATRLSGTFKIAGFIDNAVRGLNRCDCKNSSVGAGPRRYGHRDGQEAKSVRNSIATRAHVGDDTEKNAEHNGESIPAGGGPRFGPVSFRLVCARRPPSSTPSLRLQHRAHRPVNTELALGVTILSEIPALGIISWIRVNTLV